MPGDWIKVDIDTAHKPEVLKLARVLGIHKAQAFGLVVTFWGWCDKNTANGEIVGVTEEDIDIFLSQPGFAKALQDVGWLQFDPAGPRITVPSFDIHNSESAKKRAQKTRRQQKWREGSKPQSAPSPKINGEEHASLVGFNSFWNQYPRKQGKGQAERAWKSIDVELHPVIMRAIAVQSKSPDWTKDAGQFIPHPATWLKGKRWEDEIAKPQERKVAI